MSSVVKIIQNLVIFVSILSNFYSDTNLTGSFKSGFTDNLLCDLTSEDLYRQDAAMRELISRDLDDDVLEELRLIADGKFGKLGQNLAQFVLFRKGDNPHIRLGIIIDNIAQESYFDGHLFVPGEVEPEYVLTHYLRNDSDYEYLPLLFSALNSDWSHIRAILIQSLGFFPYEARVRETLFEAANDESMEVRYSTATSFCTLLLNSNESNNFENDILMVLEDLLNDDEWLVRERSALAISNWPENEIAIQILVTAVNDTNDLVREEVFWGLSRLQPKDEELVSMFIEALNDPVHMVSVRVVQCLGSIGPSAEEALPYLKELLDEWEGESLDALITAIEAIEGS